MLKQLIITCCVFILSGCVQQQVKSQMEDLNELSPSHFHNTAKLTDSDLDTSATIDTSDGFMIKAGLLGMTNFDMHLKAVINKKSGSTLIAVNSYVKYQQSSWAHFHSANYETPTGPVRADLKRTHTDVSCRGSRYAGCTYLEMMTMLINEYELRRILADAQVSNKKMWNMKLNSRTGDKRVVMSMAEIEGFLMALDDYRDGNNFKISQAN